MFDRVFDSPKITSKNLQPLIISAKLLAICLLNLINIPVLCTVIHVTFFSTYLLNNKNYNSVSQPCISIYYGWVERRSLHGILTNEKVIFQFSKKTKKDRIFSLVWNIVYWLLKALVFNFLGVGNTVFFEEKR